MSVSISLDRPHTHFTNLDFLTGKVILQLPSEATIGGIQVKLEGESRTRLSGPKHPHHDQSDKRRTELEVHKLLYKVLTLFPTPAVFNAEKPTTVYTFAAGTYEYPFQFKVASFSRPMFGAFRTHKLPVSLQQCVQHPQ